MATLFVRASTSQFGATQSSTLPQALAARSTAGNTYLVHVSWSDNFGSRHITSVTDNASPANTYTQVGTNNVDGTNGQSLATYIATGITLPASGVTTVTVTFDDVTTDGREISFEEYLTSRLDGTNFAKHQAATSGTGANNCTVSTALTPSANGAEIVCHCVNSSDSTVVALGTGVAFVSRAANATGVTSITESFPQTTAAAVTATAKIASSGKSYLINAEVLIPGSGSSFTGSAAFGASVALTATDTPAIGNTAALSASVALATSGLPNPKTALSFTVSTSLAMTDTPAISQTVALGASVALATTAMITASGAATLSGSVALTATDKPAFGQSAAYAASVGLAALGKAAVSQSATLSGAVALTTTDTPAIGNTATLAGSVMLSATGATGGSIPVGFTAAAALTTTDKPALSQVASFATGATLTAIGKPALTQALGVTAGAVLSASGNASLGKAVALAASVALATPGKPQPSSSLGVTAGAILSALGVPNLAGVPALSAGVTLAATGTTPQAGHNYVLTARLTGIRRYAAIIGARRYEASVTGSRRYEAAVTEVRRYSGSVGERRYSATIEDD